MRVKLWLVGWCGLVVGLAGCSRPEGEVPAPPTVPPLSAAAKQAAAEQGKRIVAEAFQLLSTNLLTAIQQGGVSNALPFCSVAALPLTRSIADTQGVTLRRFSHKPRNPQGRAEPAELVILQQFETALRASTNPPAPIVTNLVAGQATFFAPIVLAQPLCLKCHGEPGTEIQPEHLAIIQQLYPQDQATGFKPGELRGAWRVDFPLARLEPAR